MRVLGLIGGGVFALAGLAWLLAFGYTRGWHLERVEPERISSLLRPHDDVLLPDGSGPFPAVVQFHGCGGKRANQGEWARLFRESGYAAVVVDSYAGRGVDGRDVCSGRRLLGAERAGDVLVSLEDVRRLPFVDAGRIVLAGWSHGGWSIMELLSMDPPRDVPPNLAGAPERGLQGVTGVLLFYPYCGVAARAPSWQMRARTLFLLAGRDRVASADDCRDYAGALERSGIPVATAVYAGADHGFDHRRAGGRSPVDERAHASARRDVRRFLTSLAAGGRAWAPGA